MLVTIHMKSGKSFFVQATVDQAPTLASRLSAIMGGSYGQEARKDQSSPYMRSLELTVGVNCDKITVAGVSYRGRDTTSLTLAAKEVEFIHNDR